MKSTAYTLSLNSKYGWGNMVRSYYHLLNVFGWKSDPVCNGDLQTLVWYGGNE